MDAIGMNDWQFLLLQVLHDALIKQQGSNRAVICGRLLAAGNGNAGDPTPTPTSSPPPAPLKQSRRSCYIPASFGE